MINFNIRGYFTRILQYSLQEMGNKKAANHEDLLLISLIFVFCNDIVWKVLVELVSS